MTQSEIAKVRAAMESKFPALTRVHRSAVLLARSCSDYPTTKGKASNQLFTDLRQISARRLSRWEVDDSTQDEEGASQHPLHLNTHPQPNTKTVIHRHMQQKNAI